MSIMIVTISSNTILQSNRAYLHNHHRHYCVMPCVSCRLKWRPLLSLSFSPTTPQQNCRKSWPNPQLPHPRAKGAQTALYCSIVHPTAGPALRQVLKIPECVAGAKASALRVSAGLGKSSGAERAAKSAACVGAPSKRRTSGTGEEAVFRYPGECQRQALGPELVEIGPLGSYFSYL